MEKEEIEIALKKIEILTGYELPEYFKKVYRKFNGGIVNGVKLLKLDEIISEMIACDELELEPIKIKVEPDLAIKKVCYNSSRVPFITDYSGNYIGIDFKPGKDGISGQIINYGVDENLMRVFANSFEDFIKKFSEVKEFDRKIYVTDYLLKINFDAKKEIPEEKMPKKVSLPKLKKVEKNDELVITCNKVIEITEKELKEIVKLFEKIILDVKVDVNVIKYKIINLNYRIKNYLDYNSRTMESGKAFWNKYNAYDKAEIKGYSLSLKMTLEVNENNMYKNVGDEAIFIDIDKDTVLIKYRQKLDSKAFRYGYNSLCEYLEKIIK